MKKASLSRPRKVHASNTTKRDCEFARFLYVPPVATNVTMAAVGLLPLLDGSTTVRIRDGVRVRNVGATSGPASTEATLSVRGTFGSFDPPRVVSVTAADPTNSRPGFSDGDTVVIRFNMPLSVRYRNWGRQGLRHVTNQHDSAAGAGGPRPLLTRSSSSRASLARTTLARGRTRAHLSLR